MLEHVPDLVRTDLALAALLGEVEDRGECIVVRSPHNPGFYHGNYLFLPGPPEDLDLWCQRFEDAFPPEVRHRCLCWSGGEVSPAVAARARELDFTPGSGVGLALDAVPADVPTPALSWTVRPLDPETEFERFEALNIACDPADLSGTDSYKAFKRRIRRTIRAWMQGGHATWWGAFDGERQIGQCGFAVFGDLGRFQAVETHPAYRRRGVCSALIAAVAGHAFSRLGCRRVLLEADGVGPAIGLYRRLGFEPDGEVQHLVRESEAMQVLPEALGHQPDVQSLLRAAFGSPAEAGLVETLRRMDGALSLVAVRSGRVQGHIFFTPVRVQVGDGSWSAVALGPLAVRPELQRQGIGTRLVHAGLDACRAAGHDVCFVLGDPSYYARFGFVSALRNGVTAPFDVDPDVFMLAELTPGALAGRTGRVAYDPAFDGV